MMKEEENEKINKKMKNPHIDIYSDEKQFISPTKKEKISQH